MGLDYLKNNVNWRDKSYVSLKIREIYRNHFTGFSYVTDVLHKFYILKIDVLNKYMYKT